MELPDKLQNLPFNCGIYAVWMVFQHHAIDLEVDDLLKLCRYSEEEGTSTIALAVALKKLGMQVHFHTDPDDDLQPTEQWFYQQAQDVQMPILAALSYTEILQAVEQGKFVMVYYDLPSGEGNHSLIYEMDAESISFFDHFDVYTAEQFEQLRSAEGICRQVIVIDVNYENLYTDE